MSCPHSQLGTPDRCSQCLGAAARIVDQQADVLIIDGQPVRAIASPAPMRHYQRKGGKR